MATVGDVGDFQWRLSVGNTWGFQWGFHICSFNSLACPHVLLQEDLMKERQRAMAMPEPVPATESVTTDAHAFFFLLFDCTLVC